MRVWNVIPWVNDTMDTLGTEVSRCLGKVSLVRSVIKTVLISCVSCSVCLCAAEGTKASSEVKSSGATGKSAAVLKVSKPNAVPAPAATVTAPAASAGSVSVAGKTDGAVTSSVKKPTVVDALASRKAENMSHARKRFPEVDMNLVLRFYEEYSPDLLDEWERRCRESLERSNGYFLSLVEHFVHLEAVRGSDRAEYMRLLEYELLQRQVRQVSQEIIRLVAMGQDLLSRETEEARLLHLEQAKADLKALLERSFDESLRQQAYEIDKLEAEVSELRRILDTRRQNRQMTLEERFRKLTGQPMPKGVDGQ